MGYQFDWSIIDQVWPALMQGLTTTLLIAVITILISSVLAFPVAFARMSEIGIIRWIAQIYIEIFRCTPMLVQLIWVFYALPALTGVAFPSLFTVIVALTLNLTAFMAEVYRAGLQSVPKEQIEAAEVLQLSRFSIMRLIVIPQAFKQQIPAVLSLNIQLFKDTSLVSVLGVAEITFQGNVMASQTYRPMEVFTLVALVYFAFAFPATLITSYIERRMIRQGNRPTKGSKSLLAGLLPGQRPGPVVAETTEDANSDVRPDATANIRTGGSS
ncbi:MULTISPECIES: amino acid ABC transporter permease [Microbacterium]|uniref:amino acid ABC transporter permease n=1 Tax=Microbacterium TaxID=33882 RepID=UPI000D65525B|nr:MULTISPECIES: amino acid ABC transporter permease [Microbacterium]